MVLDPANSFLSGTWHLLGQYLADDAMHAQISKHHHLYVRRPSYFDGSEGAKSKSPGAAQVISPVFHPADHFALKHVDSIRGDRMTLEKGDFSDITKGAGGSAGAMGPTATTATGLNPVGVSAAAAERAHPALGKKAGTHSGKKTPHYMTETPAFTNSKNLNGRADRLQKVPQLRPFLGRTSPPYATPTRAVPHPLLGAHTIYFWGIFVMSHAI